MSNGYVPVGRMSLWVAFWALLALSPPAMGAAVQAATPPWGPVQQVKGASPERLLVKGKPYVYFRVAPRWPIQFVVRGPARLIVISRAERDSGSTGPAPYSLRVLAAHSVLEGQATESSPSPEARLAGGRAVLLCERRRLVVPIREREQEVWITVSGTKGVYVRLLVLPIDEARGAIRDTTSGEEE